nr:MAG TPA_asm: hypothetical protein [Caudoviricetes sp.]
MSVFYKLQIIKYCVFVGCIFLYDHVIINR